MEAATPLRFPQVRTAEDRLHVEHLVVEDPCAVRLVREREESGDDPVKAVVDAIEIGARVLDREQTAAQTEFVRAELERSTKEVEATLSEQTERLAREMGESFKALFGPDDGALARELKRLFDDGSAGAVQHKVSGKVDEVLRRNQQEFLDRFFSADGRNPLADLKGALLAMAKQAADRQAESLRAVEERLGTMQIEIKELKAEREKALEVAEERERGTAKGRSFEQQVADAVDAIAVAQGDVADAVGDLEGATGKVGDVVVEIDAARGPCQGRIVFEAKNRQLSRPAALRELDDALAERDAKFAVLVVPSDDKVPARMTPLREYNGDKLIVSFDPDEGGRTALELAYSLARARVLLARGETTGLDAGEVREAIERALQTLEQVRLVKQQLTGATTHIEKGKDLVDDLARAVKGHLADADALLARAQASD